jgi:hypothetical protein
MFPVIEKLIVCMKGISLQSVLVSGCPRNAHKVSCRACFIHSGMDIPKVTVGVGYIGHFLLTQLFLDKLKESAPARIVWMSASAKIPADIDWKDIGYDYDCKTIWL